MIIIKAYIRQKESIFKNEEKIIGNKGIDPYYR